MWWQAQILSVGVTHWYAVKANSFPVIHLNGDTTQQFKHQNSQSKK